MQLKQTKSDTGSRFIDFLKAQFDIGLKTDYNFVRAEKKSNKKNSEAALSNIIKRHLPNENKDADERAATVWAGKLRKDFTKLINTRKINPKYKQGDYFNNEINPHAHINKLLIYLR